MRPAFLWAAAVVAALSAPHAALAAEVPARDIAVWRVGREAVPTAALRFEPFAEKALGASVAAADLGTDGVSEILVGSGFGRPPLVRVLRADGSSIADIAPYDQGMLQGVHVAAGDLDGDGKAEIVTGTGPGATAHVRVFDAAGKERFIAGGFFPYGEDFRGGVNVAVGDIDGDGKAEIVTAAGPTGGPRIKVWTREGTAIADFFAFENALPVGLSVAAGDVDGDGRAEILAALAREAPPYVRVFDGSGNEEYEFLVLDEAFRGGLNLAAGDVDGDGLVEILAGPNGGGGPHVQIFRHDGRRIASFFSDDPSYKGGVLVAAGQFGGLGPSVLTMPAERNVSGRPHLARYIHVDISEQRLRAFEYGRLVKSFLVATGERRFPTPKGEFSVLDKPYKVRYRWSYGPGHPENYDLGWVNWNLRFYPHVYIHYAPWRRVFGVRGSHGCVNVDKASAQWIYGWAELGTPVVIED